MKSSKLQEWALIAEIASAIFVVASIIFLILEIRANTEAMQSAGLQSIAERTQQMTLNVALDPELAEIQGRLLGISGPDTRAVSYMVSVLKIGEESFLQHRDGFLNEEVWQTRASYVLMHLQTQEARDFMSVFQQSGNFVPAYLQWLDDAITERYGQ